VFERQIALVRLYETDDLYVELWGPRVIVARRYRFRFASAVHCSTLSEAENRELYEEVQ